MAYDRIVALNVTDQTGYQRYRAAMTPLLREYGGDFRHDFTVSSVLKSEVEHPVNRLFVIGFPSREAHDRFFTDERYLLARKTHFEGSVQHATILGSLES